MGSAEGGGFGFAEGAEFAGAALDDAAGDFVRKRGGFGAGALRERKNVEIGEGQALDESERCGVVVFRFAGEASDYVGADGGVREAFADEFDAAGVVFGAIPAMHGGENAIRSGLQRHVEVLGDALRGSEEFDKISRNVERFDGADAQAFDSGFAEDAAEEILEFDARGKVAAVSAEIDATQDNFAISGIAETLNFMENGFRRQAAALAADKRNHAIGAAGVAAVLDFEGRASVIPFPAEHGSGEQRALFENIAG